MAFQSSPGNATPHRSTFYYGWVIVIICTLMMGITYGLMYSYSVFFKPLAEYFNWDRATVSLVYSASLIIRGAISIGVGWLADKYGAKKLMIFCGFMIGLGLILSSQIQNLWQFFITYALIEAIGLSGTFGIATAVTSRWFLKNRGLALGIVSSGVGLGTLLIVPGNERLISSLGWSQAFIISGATAGLLLIVTAFFLRPVPKSLSAFNSEAAVPATRLKSQKQSSPPVELGLSQAIRTPRMIILIAVYACIFFCTQLVIVHLVNYATDIGVTPLVAATFVSIIGVISIGGRLVMGIWADRLGIHNTLILCCGLLIVSLVFLIFTRQVWAFYLFAAIFGFAYGGEVPQIPLFVAKFCGTKAMAALIGLTLFVGNIGGALGPWVGGEIYDMTAHYEWAFAIGAIISLTALILAFILKRQNRKITNNQETITKQIQNKKF